MPYLSAIFNCATILKSGVARSVMACGAAFAESESESARAMAEVIVY